MLAIPAADWLNVPLKVSEEPLSSHLDVFAEKVLVISSSEQHEVVDVQEGFEALIAEQVDVIIHNRFKKFVRRQHVPPNRISEVITAAVQSCIDGREMALHIAQFFINPFKAQAQCSH